MGVTITAKNTRSFDCSYGGFFNLRKNIAKLYDLEFGEHYSNIMKCCSDQDYASFDEKTEEILSNPRFSPEDQDLIDFFFASDCEGKINYKTCKKIYDLIKDIDFGSRIFMYGAYSDGKDYEYFKSFLKECYSYHRNMIWY